MHPARTSRLPAKASLHFDNGMEDAMTTQTQRRGITRGWAHGLVAAAWIGLAVAAFGQGGSANFDQVTVTNWVHANSAVSTNYFMGTVGIGTNSPRAALQVLGNTDLVGGLSVSGAVVVVRQGDVGMGIFTNGVAGGGMSGGLPAGTTGAFMYFNGTSWVAMTNLYVDTASGRVYFSTSGTGAYATPGGNIALNGKWLSGDGGNEGVAVDSAGNVGIGTASPAANLHISASTATVRMESTATDNYAVASIQMRVAGANRAAVGGERFSNDANKGRLLLATATNASDPVTHVVLDETGALNLDWSTVGRNTRGLWWRTGNGSAARAAYVYMNLTGGVFRVVGVNTNTWVDVPLAQVSSTAGWSGYSTAAVKQNIRPMDAEGRSAVRADFANLKTYTYERVDDPGRPEMGVIAEEAPQWIKGNDPDTVNPIRWLGYLTTVIKDQQAQIDDLRRQLDAIQKP